MGLDSVQLIFEIENAFGLDIPDAIWVTLGTSRDVVNYVAEVQNLTSAVSELEHGRLDVLLSLLRNAPGGRADTRAETVAKDCFVPNPKYVEAWLQQELRLDIPDLTHMFSTPQQTWLGRALEGILYNRRSDGMVTIRHLNDAINARNFHFERSKHDLQSWYEAYLVLMQVLARKLGVPLIQQGPDKAFSNDYGID